MKNDMQSTDTSQSDLILIAESFDAKTLSNMAIALERICASVAGSEKHRARRHIAGRIAQCARSGNRGLASLIQAGETAAAELRQCKAD
jgi:hypothetical protein